MAEPTLAEVFGTGAAKLTSGASAPSAGLFIPAQVFTDRGLNTAFTTATAEQIYVALTLQALTSLTEEIRATDVTNRTVTVFTSDDSVDLVNTANGAFYRRIVSISLYKPTTIPTIDPDDY